MDALEYAESIINWVKAQPGGGATYTAVRSHFGHEDAFIFAWLAAQRSQVFNPYLCDVPAKRSVTGGAWVEVRTVKGFNDRDSPRRGEVWRDRRGEQYRIVALADGLEAFTGAAVVFMDLKTAEFLWVSQTNFMGRERDDLGQLHYRFERVKE